MSFTDLIFVSMEDWDDHWRRNQFVCAEFARRHPQNKILFVAPPRDISNSWRRGRIGPELARPVTNVAPGFENICVTRPLKLLPNSLAAGRVVNEWMLRRHVRAAARRLGLVSPLLWLNPHYGIHMARRMGESAVLYDITDDWTTLSQSRRAARLVARQDEQLCRVADATIVCSKRLLEMKKGVARSIHLIPNGVDVDHYAGVRRCTSPLPPLTTTWQKPVLGYTGTIHPDRVDVQLVKALASARIGSVVMVGPNHLSAMDNQTLLGLGNVYMPGVVPYADIAKYMAAFDVCITPHRVTPFTESLNPIKLWEYLAAGLPIVSTDVAGFRDYQPLVRITRTAEEFILAAREALAERSQGDQHAARRISEAAKHSWADRVDRIEEVMAAAIERVRVPGLGPIAGANSAELRFAR